MTFGSTVYVIPKWGDHPITELRAQPVELWVNALDLEPRSKGAIRALISALWQFAMWSEKVQAEVNPISLVKIPNSSQRMRKPRSLTVEEFHSLVAHLKNPFRTISYVQIGEGLRISESLGLRWADIDWLHGKLYVRRSIVRQRIGDTKTTTSEAALPVGPELAEILKAWRQDSQFCGDTDWIFASPAQLGRLPWSADAVLDAYRGASELAKVALVTTHCLRHTYRSWMGVTGTQLDVQQRMMRHSDIRTTMNTYGEVFDDRMAEAHSKVMDLALNGSQTDRNGS
jgi:integrase